MQRGAASTAFSITATARNDTGRLLVRETPRRRIGTGYRSDAAIFVVAGWVGRSDTHRLSDAI
jgi:hypothetical protein